MSPKGSQCGLWQLVMQTCPIPKIPFEPSMHYGSETTVMNQQCLFLPLLSPEAAPEVGFLSLSMI